MNRKTILALSAVIILGTVSNIALAADQVQPDATTQSNNPPTQSSNEVTNKPVFKSHKAAKNKIQRHTKIANAQQGKKLKGGTLGVDIQIANYSNHSVNVTNPIDLEIYPNEVWNIENTYYNKCTPVSIENRQHTVFRSDCVCNYAIITISSRDQVTIDSEDCIDS